LTSASDVRKAAGWSLLTGLIGQFGQVSVTMLLAALLGPARFGVVALASMYLLLVDLLIRQGVGQAIVQREDLRDAHLDTAFVMTVGSAAVISLATITLAPGDSSLFGAPELTNLLRVLSGISFLRALGQIPLALFERDLDYRGRAIVLNAAVICGGIAGIVSALAGAGEYALAYQLYAEVIVAVSLIYARSDWRPHIRFERKAAAELLSSSTGTLLATIGLFASQRIETIVIGIFFGPLAVGLYKFSSRVVELVISVTAGALGSLSLAALSRVQDDPRRFADQTNSVMRSSTTLAAPLLAIVFVGSRVTVELFGREWDGAIPVMRILALAGIARVLVFHTSPIQEARGKPYQAAATLWLASLVSILAVTAFAAMNSSSSPVPMVRGIAVVRLVIQVVVIGPALFALIARVASTTVWRLLKSVEPPLVVSAAVVGVAYPIDILMSHTDLSLVAQGAAVGTAAATVAVVGMLVISDEVRNVARHVVDRVLS